MRSWIIRVSVLIAALLPHRAAAESPKASFPDLLSGAGLSYKGTIAFGADTDYKRGEWRDGPPAFWTITASSGPVWLRLELTRNITRELAERTARERTSRIDGLFSGAAAYPGMVTMLIAVPKELRPVDIREGRAGREVKLLYATPGMAYGAGEDSLVSHKGLLGHIYCKKGSLLAQIELFYPKTGFDLKAALKEYDSFGCAAAVRRK